MRALIFIRYILREFPFLVIGSSLILMVASLVEAFTLFIIAPIIDTLISPELQGASPTTGRIQKIMISVGLPVTLWALFAFYIALNVLKSGIQTFSAYLILRIKYALSRDLIVGSSKDFFKAGWTFFRNSQQGTLLNTFIREIAIVGDAFAGMARFSASALQLGILILVPLYISWQVMSISMGVALLLAMPLMVLGKVSHRLGTKNTSTANEVSIFIQESLSSAKVILGFANQQKCSKLLEHKFNSHVSATLKSQTFVAAITNIYSPLGLLGLVVTLFTARWFALPIGETSILIVSFIKIIPIIGQVTSQKTLMDNSFPSYEQIINLRTRAKKLKQRNGSKQFTGFNNAIKIEALSFSYDGRKTVLKNVNATIPKGKMIAFVGESGAGKSTLIDSIIGFNKPIAGQIKIDDIPLQDFNVNSYRKKIGYVPQESILFNMSIRDNLIWSKEDSTEEDIKKACMLANADEFIEKFPEKYETLVGDRGVRLSGGQLQRIALARAIIRRPDVLILDEATSALDTKSERKIQKAIEKISTETTLIVVAHRLSTIVNADYVYVLENGSIKEKGSYEDLILQRGQFYNMVYSQKFSDAEKIINPHHQSRTLAFEENC
jgi:ABC-type multidrug transport system fused ATPase/permease subunit